MDYEVVCTLLNTNVTGKIIHPSQFALWIKNTFNNIVRYLYGLERCDRVSQYAETIYNMSFECFMSLKALLFLHKIVYENKPNYLYDRPRFARSNMGNKMVQINYCTRNSEKQLFIRAIRLWSQIPNNIQLLHSSLNNL